MTAPTNTNTLVAIVTLTIAIAQAMGAQEKHIAPEVIAGYGTDDEQCPSMEIIEKAIEDITNMATAIVDSYYQVEGDVAVPECGAGLWHRVAYLNMSDPSQQCPSAWREYRNNSYRVRACGRPLLSENCASKTYPVTHQYSRVCGRVIGYQYESPDAFYRHRPGNTINQTYVDGVSVTYGTPHKHIWTYAAAWNEGRNADRLSRDYTKILCPCKYSGAQRPPPFVGNNYYCESANPNDDFANNVLYRADKLWDGEQCATEGTCCSGPPWFSVQLPSHSSEDIEVRICGDERTSNEDTPIELLEIYIR